jgi:UDP-glucose 4-epimerase
MYLITGHKGFIGRNLITYMNRKSIPYTFTNWKEADTVIHLSAATNVRKSIIKPVENFNKNSLGTFNLLKKSLDHNIKRFIFTSSMGVTLPQSPYLASKVTGEAYCRAFSHSYNLKTHVLRLSNVYGPCSEYKDSVIAKFIKATINKETFEIYGDGTQTRDFVYVEDLLPEILIPKLPLTPLCSGTTTSINSLLNNLILLSKEFFNYVPKISHIRSQPGEITTVKPDRGIFGAHDLETGLRKTYQWYAESL